MAITKKKTKKPKKASVEMTIWGGILSYPDLHEPKPYKGKIYYRTDVLLESDHPQLKELRAAVNKVRVAQFGEDKEEWPEKAKKVFVRDGDKREDQKTYAGRFYITASTQNPVPVVDPKGKAFNPQMVKGGMFANVAINISAWEFDGDEGVSIYLQGVQVDTSKPKLQGFGGGKSVEQMFGKGKPGEEGEEEEEQEEEEDDTPRGKKKKDLKAKDFDEEEDTPPKTKSGKKKPKDEEE